MGQNKLTAQQLADFLISREPSPRINCTPMELAEYFINESEIEGVRGDIAFMQAIHETGWFRFGGQVLPEQNNFGGIGAVNHSPVGAGAWFDTPQIGVRAQIHHLKTYATDAPLTTQNASPRAHFVQRGIAPHWEDLNGRWAVPGNTYAQKILALYDRAIVELSGAKGKLLQDMLVYNAIVTLHNFGVINSPHYWHQNYSNLLYVDQLLINAADKLYKMSAITESTETTNP
jgi:hypothetical protein